MSAGAVQQQYTPEEIEAMSTADLLAAYKRTGDEELKWPLVLRYEGLIKSAALQIRGVYSSFAQVDDIVSEGILTLLSAIDKFDCFIDVKHFFFFYIIIVESTRLLLCLCFLLGA